VEQDRFEGVSRAAGAAHGVVLLKGVPTVIGEPDAPLLIVGSGGPVLATGGSGDLLCGLIATFVAQGANPLVASALGAHALGRAGELAAERRTARAARPHDVLAALPTVWRAWDAPGVSEPPVLLSLRAPAGL
jgi:NAD(P)H-hydrate epimerase